MAFLVSGKSAPEKTPEERTAIQAAHMGNIGKLADEGKLVIAGPFGHPSPDDSMRGIFVFDTRTVEEARAWTETDPAVQAGVFGMELARIETGTELRKALGIYKQKLEAAGGDHSKVGMRGYAVVLAKDARRAKEALAGNVVFEGELESSARGNYLAVLATEGEEATRSVLDPISAELGEHVVFPWWASTTLLELSARAP